MLLHRRRLVRAAWLPAAVVTVALVGCGPAVGGPAAPGTPLPSGTRATAVVPSGPGVGPVPTSTPAADPPDPDFPEPSPAFADHFTDPIYHDLGEELAPFGSDEGFDTLYSWRERRGDLTGCTTVRSMLGEDEAAASAATARPSDDDPAQDGLIVGVGFTLLLLTGHIDPEGKQLVTDAVLREARYYDDESIREFPVLLRDLAGFPATSC